VQREVVEFRAEEPPDHEPEEDIPGKLPRVPAALELDREDPGAGDEREEDHQPEGRDREVAAFDQGRVHARSVRYAVLERSATLIIPKRTSIVPPDRGAIADAPAAAASATVTAEAPRSPGAPSAVPTRRRARSLRPGPGSARRRRQD